MELWRRYGIQNLDMVFLFQKTWPYTIFEKRSFFHLTPGLNKLFVPFANHSKGAERRGRVKVGKTFAPWARVLPTVGLKHFFNHSMICKSYNVNTYMNGYWIFHKKCFISTHSYHTNGGEKERKRKRERKREKER